MGNIVGEPTPSYVIQQVEERQKVHGKLTRTTQDLNYLNSKTAWVKLISSVDITEDVPNPTIKNLGLTDSQLAEKYVLFNGITDESPSSGAEETYQRAGIARDRSINNRSAYGVGGLEFGLSPMMGLTSVNVSAKNRGSLRTAKVDIVANNRVQFEIIETLYIKLGYFMLLEWGWTNYLKNNGTYELDNPHSLADTFLLRKTGYNDLLTLIEEKRKASEGNYDALIGKVTNFNWTFEPTGQYKISLDLISQGDVIESLKVNTYFPDDYKTEEKQESENTEAEDNKEKTVEEIIIAYKDKSSLGKFIANNVKALDKTNRLSKTIEDKSVISFIKTMYNGSSSDDKGSTIYYIQFQRLLLWIRNNVIPTIEKGKSRFINFDLDSEENLMLLAPLSVSTDPRICNFNSQWTKGGKTGYSTLYGAEDFTKTIGKNNYGRIMNLYFNVQYVLESLDKLKNEDGDVILIDFLNFLLRGYESCTGGYNTLSVDIDPDTNTIIFRDEKPQPDRKKVDEPTAFFNTFGYNGDSSNFVRNLNFNTTITPSLATMISVGATRDGYSPGYDATGLQSINLGTFDAIKPTLVNNSGKEVNNSGEETNQDELKKLEDKYKTAVANMNKYISQITVNKDEDKPILDSEAANAYSSTIKDLIEYKQLKETKDNPEQFAGSPTIGFIPFDLGLDIDGLSGIKIYNKIAVETTFLPYNYPKALEFVVKGVDHTINGNDWKTSLTTLAIPKNPYGGGKKLNELTSISNTPSKRTSTPPPPPPGIEDTKQRAVLTRILDDGTQTLGYLDVYDESGANILYTLATVELPYKGNKNGESAIPTGEYFVKSRSNEKYGQHFHVVGSKAGNFNVIPGSNNTNRTWVLIHRAPKAPGWLQGCIGPSFTYNFANKNAQGNPNGIGTAYLNPAKAQSIQAQAKLVGTLYNVGGFKMEIKNAQSTLPNKFSDPSIQNLKKESRLAPLFKTS